MKPENKVSIKGTPPTKEQEEFIKTLIPNEKLTPEQIEELQKFFPQLKKAS